MTGQSWNDAVALPPPPSLDPWECLSCSRASPCPARVASASREGIADEVLPSSILAIPPPPTSRAQILAYVSRVRDVEAVVDQETMTHEQIESTPVRCPDPDSAGRMYAGAWTAWGGG